MILRIAFIPAGGIAAILAFVVIFAATKPKLNHAGSNIYRMKMMSIFVNMDRVMGKQFETGLNNLKNVAENRP